MDPMQTGLRYRLKRAIRQIGEQHAHLRSCYAEIRDAVKRRRDDEAQEALERLRVALEAHFGLEDEVFFPALHGLDPGCAEHLEGLSREHVGFADSLRRIRKDLERAGCEACGRAFESLAAALAEHEDQEERLVESIAARETDRPA